MIDLINTIPFWAVLLVAPAMILIELFVTASRLSYEKQRAYLRIVWQVLGVFIPAIWIFWANLTGIELSALLLIIVYFGFMKLRRFERERTMSSGEGESE